MKLTMEHNLSDSQLEEALEKALKGIRKNAENPDAPLDLNLSEVVRSEAFTLFDKVSNLMLSEIKTVIEKG